MKRASLTVSPEARRDVRLLHRLEAAEVKLESALEDVRAFRTLIDEGDSDGEH